MNTINKFNPVTTASHSKKAWRTPVLTQLGKFTGLVLQGGGKLSPPLADPGEPKKTRPSG